MKLSDFSVNPNYIIVKNMKSIFVSDKHVSKDIDNISKNIDIGDVVDTTREKEFGKQVIFKNVKLFHMNNTYYGVVNRKDIIASSKSKVNENIL